MNENQTSLPQQPIPAQGQDKTPTSASGMFFIVLMISLLALLVGGYSFYKIVYGNNSASGIYVVDGVRLTTSYLEKARKEQAAGYKTPEQIERETLATEQAVQAAIEKLVADGKVVIQSRNTLAYPSESDITAQIAEDLGITLLPVNRQTGQLGQKIGSANAVPASLPQDDIGGRTGPGLD